MTLGSQNSFDFISLPTVTVALQSSKFVVIELAYSLRWFNAFPSSNKHNPSLRISAALLVQHHLEFIIPLMTL